ncbi:MAG: DNA polymerase subunit beta [bacterium]|nr:DNA polymerase subunit beta [bacterium]
MAAKYKVRRLALFGSVLKKGYKGANDIDVLVDFEGGADFDRYFGLLKELETVFGKKVDLITYKGLNKHLKPYIQKDSVVIYEKS